MDRQKQPNPTTKNLRKNHRLNSTRKTRKKATETGSFEAIDILSMIGCPTNYASFTYLLTEHLGGPNFARWFLCLHNAQGNEKRNLPPPT
jgi:hypothetical protein